MGLVGGARARHDQRRASLDALDGRRQHPALNAPATRPRRTPGFVTNVGTYVPPGRISVHRVRPYSASTSAGSRGTAGAERAVRTATMPSDDRTTAMPNT